MVDSELLMIQDLIASKAILKDDFEKLNIIGGVDQAFFEDKIISGIVLLDYTTMDKIEEVYTVMDVNFPYIPGLLSFREAPSIIEAFGKLKRLPDILMVDGCGINHPRFAGLATHVGVELDIPTIGVAKKILCGQYKAKPEEVGEICGIFYKGKTVGTILKSKKNCNPLIIAPGHKISVNSSLEIVKTCLRGYKLPEPTRQAHMYAGSIKRRL
ncbi:MAG: deoxyribonuclease V [Halobacteriota archaeon]|nr:deoxyribonuclease V [Halobacteriota archaeon]